MARNNRSARTPLMALLRKGFREAGASKRPFDRGRRDFLKTSLILGSGLLLPGCRKSESPGPESGALSKTGAAPRVAIVGAGIAGLSAAHHLLKAGIRADIFEAASRPGGRIYTLKNLVGPGLYTEAGGEFIDSSHADMLDLARELGLKISDMRGEVYQGLHAEAWFFGGKLRSTREVLAEVKLAAKALQPDIDALPEDLGAGSEGIAAELDKMPLDEYLHKRGVIGWFGDLLKAAYVGEFGLDAGEQSSLNLLTMISLDLSSGEFTVFGESDERFRVEGGNQQIPDALAAKMETQIRYGHRLEALDGGSGEYRLFLHGPSGALEHKADTVVLALPFTLLRQVDLRVELPRAQRRAIDELGMGSNAKLFIGYSGRPWKKNGYVGNFFAEGKAQSGWDHTQTQGGEVSGLTVFQGGSAGMALGKGSPAFHAKTLEPELEKIFRGSRAAQNGKVGSFFWPGHALSLGSYSCYRPGQWTAFCGEEGKSVGDLHFAGEQCSGDFQGYMNGGAETGRRAAEAVLAKWKKAAA